MVDPSSFTINGKSHILWYIGKINGRFSLNLPCGWKGQKSNPHLMCSALLFSGTVNLFYVDKLWSFRSALQPFLRKISFGPSNPTHSSTTSSSLQYPTLSLIKYSLRLSESNSRYLKWENCLEGNCFKDLVSKSNSQGGSNVALLLHTSGNVKIKMKLIIRNWRFLRVWVQECSLVSPNMWLPFTQEWRQINLSSDPSCRLTSSATWHLLPLPLTHLDDKQSCPFSFLQGSLLFTPFDLDQPVARIFYYQELVHLLFSPSFT
jgi:hypothetical protein